MSVCYCRPVSAAAGVCYCRPVSAAAVRPVQFVSVFSGDVIKATKYVTASCMCQLLWKHQCCVDGFGGDFTLFQAVISHMSAWIFNSII